MGVCQTCSAASVLEDAGYKYELCMLLIWRYRMLLNQSEHIVSSFLAFLVNEYGKIFKVSFSVSFDHDKQGTPGHLLHGDSDQGI